MRISIKNTEDCILETIENSSTKIKFENILLA